MTTGHGPDGKNKNTDSQSTHATHKHRTPGIPITSRHHHNAKNPASALNTPAQPGWFSAAMITRSPPTASPSLSVQAGGMSPSEAGYDTIRETIKPPAGR
ncbi:unnamed protein product [Ectocarpus fasciculatus]